MNIFLITFGSRGDVQPFVALGKGLRQRGHEVTLCTAEQFEPFIREQGLRYGYMTGDLLKLLDTDAGRQAMEETVGLLGSLKSMARLVRQTNPLNKQMMMDSWAEAQQARPEVIIYHPKALGAVSIAEATDARAIMAVLQPMILPTADFPSPGMPALLSSGWYNKLSYKAVAMGYSMYGGMVNKLRTEQMGLAKMPRGSGLYQTSSGQPIPILHAYSRHVVPRPADWPDHASAPGYWFLDRSADWQPSPELEAFLAAGETPVYIGFGSMASKEPARLTRIVVDAVQQAGVRAIVATGWGGLKADNLPGSILALEHAPHDWLFPRVSGIVHHGGAGTTGAGLREGKPTLIVPFMGDQPFWGQRVTDLGAGPHPIPQKKLNAGSLSQALHMLTNSSTMRSRAAEVGEQIRDEDGVGSAVAIIEELAASRRFEAQA